MNEYPLWINGREVRSGRTAEIKIPYDASPFASVHQAGTAELDMAIESARAAARVMRSMTLAERGAILLRAHLRLAEKREHFARIVSAESGKPIREARIEADRAASTLLFSSQEAHRLAGEVVPMEASAAGKGRMAITVREPLGAVAAITPFNFPLNLSMHKIGPALAAGNAVVHKPASTTPVSALELARLLSESGLPDGALNVIPGPGGVIGDPLVEHPAVRMVTFTGSADVGVRLRSRAGMKRVTLELGNNSALVVEADAELDKCVALAVPGSFAHSGQVCISVQRIYVQRRVYQEFLDRFTAAARRLTIGHPWEDATEVSSLITVEDAERVQSWAEEAVAAGARCLCGGARNRATLEPIALAGVPASARVSCQEAFGPVVCINPFDDLDQAIEFVNDSNYGLQAGIFTRDIEKAFRAALRAEVGGFLINDVPQFRTDQMPYGGVKLSGAGREGPKYAIEEMTEPKLISWRY